MPAIPLYPPSQSQRKSTAEALNPLPQLLQTPSGLAILELQGTINMPAAEPLDASAMDVDDGKLASTPVGRIVFPGYHKDNPSNDIAWMKKVYLYVGRHQRLTGEVKRLQKPMAVIRRREAMEGVMADEEELEIMDIVYYKILFLSRPEPVSSE